MINSFRGPQSWWNPIFTHLYCISTRDICGPKNLVAASNHRSQRPIQIFYLLILVCFEFEFFFIWGDKKRRFVIEWIWVTGSTPGPIFAAFQLSGELQWLWKWSSWLCLHKCAWLHWLWSAARGFVRAFMSLFRVSTSASSEPTALTRWAAPQTSTATSASSTSSSTEQILTGLSSRGHMSPTWVGLSLTAPVVKQLELWLKTTGMEQWRERVHFVHSAKFLDVFQALKLTSRAASLLRWNRCLYSFIGVLNFEIIVAFVFVSMPPVANLVENSFYFI